MLASSLSANKDTPTKRRRTSHGTTGTAKPKNPAASTDRAAGRRRRHPAAAPPLTVPAAQEAPFVASTGAVPSPVLGPVNHYASMTTACRMLVAAVLPSGMVLTDVVYEAIKYHMFADPRMLEIAHPPAPALPDDQQGRRYTARTGDHPRDKMLLNRIRVYNEFDTNLYRVILRHKQAMAFIAGGSVTNGGGSLTGRAEKSDLNAAYYALVPIQGACEPILVEGALAAVPDWVSQWTAAWSEPPAAPSIEYTNATHRHVCVSKPLSKCRDIAEHPVYSAIEARLVCDISRALFRVKDLFAGLVPGISAPPCVDPHHVMPHMLTAGVLEKWNQRRQLFTPFVPPATFDGSAPWARRLSVPGEAMSLHRVVVANIDMQKATRLDLPYEVTFTVTYKCFPRLSENVFGNDVPLRRLSNPSYAKSAECGQLSSVTVEVLEGKHDSLGESIYIEMERKDILLDHNGASVATLSPKDSAIFNHNLRTLSAFYRSVRESARQYLAPLLSVTSDSGAQTPEGESADPMALFIASSYYNLILLGLIFYCPTGFNALSSDAEKARRNSVALAVLPTMLDADFGEGKVMGLIAADVPVNQDLLDSPAFLQLLAHLAECKHIVDVTADVTMRIADRKPYVLEVTHNFETTVLGGRKHTIVVGQHYSATDPNTGREIYTEKTPDSATPTTTTTTRKRGSEGKAVFGAPKRGTSKPE